MKNFTKKLLKVVLLFFILFSLFNINIKQYINQSVNYFNNNTQIKELNYNKLNDLFSTNLFEEMPFLLDFNNELPNSVSNSIDYVGDKYYYTQRVQEYTLQASDIEGLTDLSETIQRVNIKTDNINDVIDLGVTSTGEKMMTTISIPRGSADPLTTPYLHYFTTSTLLFFISFPLGTYASLVEAQANLTGTKIWYQLATPIITELDYILYSPLYQSTFDLLTEEQIKLQMDQFIEKPYLFIDYKNLYLLNLDLTTEDIDYYYNLYLKNRRN